MLEAILVGLILGGGSALAMLFVISMANGIEAAHCDYFADVLGANREMDIRDVKFVEIDGEIYVAA